MEVLDQPQVALAGLDRSVAERELDLLKRGPGLAGELGEGAAQVVRRAVVDSPSPDGSPIRESAGFRVRETNCGEF